MAIQKIIETVKYPLAKIISRAIMYGLTAILGARAIDAQGDVESIGSAVAAIVLLLIAGGIDVVLNRRDLAEIPPKKKK